MSDQPQPTDINELLINLEDGTWKQQLETAISLVAQSVVEHRKAGRVTFILNIKTTKMPTRLNVEHEIKYLEPTAKGKLNEGNKKQTQMYLNKEGDVTLQPRDQKQLFDNDGKPLLSVVA